MKRAPILLLLLLFVSTALIRGQEQGNRPSAEEIEEQQKNIPALTVETFDDFVELTDDLIIIEFYEPKCYNCDKLGETLLETQEKAEQLGLNVTIARIDGSKSQPLVSRFAVDGFPNLHYRTRASKKDLGKWKPYVGPKETMDLLRFIADENRSKVPAKLKTVADVERFIEQEQTMTDLDTVFSEKPVLVGFFPYAKRIVEMRRFRAFLDEVTEHGNPAVKTALSSVGVHFAGKKDAVPTSTVVRNHTVAIPSLVLFKRDGSIFEFNPPKPAVPVQATPTEEAAQTQDAEAPVHDEEPVVVDSLEGATAEDEATHVDENPDEHSTEHEEEDKKKGKDKHKEKKEEKHKEKKEKLTKEAKKQQERELWQQLQRATSWKVTDMIEWIMKVSQPLVPEVGHWNFNPLIAQGRPLYIAWVDLSKRSKAEADEAGVRFWEDTVSAVINLARDYSNKLTFGYAGGDRYPGIAKMFGVTDLVGYVIIDPSAVQSKYLPEGTINDVEGGSEEAFIRKHIEAYLAGTLKPFFQSEPAPPAAENEDNDEVPVKTVVFDNYKQIVLNENKDVLLEYYIPSCPHCQSLAPVLEQLGQSVSKAKDIVIAKMNMDGNDLPIESEVTLQGYPAIYFYAAKDKAHPISYDGARTVDAFLHFLKHHQTVYAGGDLPFGQSGESEKVRDEL